MRLCRDTIRENCDGWQRRKMTELEKQELTEIKLEKEARLEKQKRKKEEFAEGRKIISKEEAFLRRMEIAEMKENAWKWRGTKSSHEEYSGRKEIKKKIVEKEIILEKIKKKVMEEEVEEKSRKKIFLEKWKEREDRKIRQRAAEESW